MPSFIITGSLGSGKSLIAVSRIRDYLMQGRAVATNLDLRLEKLVNPDAKKVRVYRLPDKPTAADIAVLGSGNTTADESNNGILVLDELALWMNSRKWQSTGRDDLIDFAVQSRKLGWDVHVIAQDESLIDNQVREIIGEHIVKCRRLDRMKIPVISTAIKLCTLGLVDLRLPRVHVGVVVYAPMDQVIDTWIYKGTDLYSAYNTKQLFQTNCGFSTYQYLPPFYTYWRHRIKPRNFYMRITKIYFRKYSRSFAFFLGALFSATSSVWLPIVTPHLPTFMRHYVHTDTQTDKQPTKQGGSINQPSSSSSAASTILDQLTGYHVDTLRVSETASFVTLVKDGAPRITGQDIRNAGAIWYPSKAGVRVVHNTKAVEIGW